MNRRQQSSAIGGGAEKQREISLAPQSEVRTAGRAGKIIDRGDFPGGPVFKTLCLHCRRHGFDPWSVTYDSTCHTPWPKKKKKITERNLTGTEDLENTEYQPVALYCCDGQENKERTPPSAIVPVYRARWSMGIRKENRNKGSRYSDQKPCWRKSCNPALK